MSGPEGPRRPAPPVPPHAPQGAPSGARRDVRDLDDAGPPVLAPREEAQIEQAVALVARSGRGPAVAGILITAAFLLGLLRPWDLLVAPASDALPAPGRPAADAPPGTAGPASGLEGLLAGASEDAAERTAPPLPQRALTCAYPSQWRSATIEDWTSRQARVWRAAAVVQASGPTDPSIPFEPIVAATVTAIGWCAPVVPPDRPPLALTATLYRVLDGVARPVPYDRLEPDAPDALGELWVPRPLGVGNRPTWPMGRYVIELRSDSGGYVRYLGLELSDHVIRPSAESGVATAPPPSP